MGSLADLKALYKKQAILRMKMNNIEAFISAFKFGDNVHEIKNRISELPNLRDEFEKTCVNIMVLTDTKSSNGDKKDDEEDSDDDDLKELEDFDKRYHQLLGNLQNMLALNQPTSTPPSVSPTGSQTIAQATHHFQNTVRLPVISLPEFSGAYNEWLPFYDAFKSLIHENQMLDTCQKFHYLKSCLKGEALRSIDSLTISNANYVSAWDLLQKRYKNERLIVQSHVQAILNAPEITKNSGETLRKLLDVIIANTEALKVLNIDVDSCDAFITTIVMGKLDYQSRKEFENNLTTNVPSRRELIEFLEKRCNILESLNQNVKTKVSLPKNVTQKFGNPSYRASHVVASKWSCYFCRERHLVTQCSKFLALKGNERFAEVKKRKLCNNCLRDNHVTSACRATDCGICHARTHHTLLHVDRSKSENETVGQSQTEKKDTNENPTKQSSANCCSQRDEPNGVLSTAVVLIKDPTGKYTGCRSLLDPGSQLNLISESVCKRLKLITKATNLTVWGVNKKQNNVNEMTTITMRSVHYPYEFKVNCYVTKNVTVNIPIASFDKIPLGVPSDVSLADPQFNESGPVDIILGTEVFWNVLGSERIKLSPNLYLAETLLGWVIGGAMMNTSGKNVNASCNLNVKGKETEINKLLEKFWTQEELQDVKNEMKVEEAQCEKHFMAKYQRDEGSGRFIVDLPFKNLDTVMGDSSKMALKRFLSLERKFRKDPEFKNKYAQTINEYLLSGIIEEVPKNELEASNCFYLPHSGVFKKVENPKLRIVFDASAKASNGKSLNDHLMTGPNLQRDLFDIVCRFRMHKIVFACDIEKMFLQILVNKKHVDFQRLFWRYNEDEEVKIFRLLRLVFGFTSSPFIAMRCIQQLAYESAEEFPEASRVLMEDRYMDDILSGADSQEKAIILIEQIKEILNRGGFRLPKWTSNDPKILPLPVHKQGASIELNFDEANASKVLGLWWYPGDDTLSYRVEPPELTDTLTKRIILSSIAKLYDPIGLVSPVIVKAKILMQSLWALNLGWDEQVPEDVKIAWTKYIDELQQLNRLKVPRRVIVENHAQTELVAFCDASLRAYGANIYVRTKTNNRYYSRLLCSKSRVSPIKVVTLPRLELCAALLAVRLMKKVADVMKLESCKKYYFSDSTIVLHYLNANANTWQVYVANRVAEIQSNTDVKQWYHVRSELNPADVVSRGEYPTKLMDSLLYWQGPDFLMKENEEWPISVPPLGESEVPEKRKIALVTAIQEEISLILRFSNFQKLQRVTAYVLRFVNNTKNKNNLIRGYLKADELKEAHDKIVMLAQKSKFMEEIAALSQQQPISNKSKLYTLDPFLDEKGILRVGGRLKLSSLPYGRKHPIILPNGHHVTKMLIRQEHYNLLHAGLTQTLASFRTKYWPLRGKDEVRRIIHFCIKCFRASPKLVVQKMGNLPKDRIEPSRPFLKVGLDYFGPLHLKQGGKRSKVTVKGWGAIFVCMVTRAVHLELVSDLTTESFMNALKRLISRRGKISTIYCDNATTFVGAKTEIDRIQNFLLSEKTQSEMQSFLANEGICWNFIPPRAPNFGGLWERLVRSTKQHLKKITSTALLTFEEAATLFTQIEAVINCRPLTPMSNDPSDYEILTPAHFLVGDSLMVLPEVDVQDIPENRLSRWQRVQKLRQNFWKRWSREVLTQLQQRQKWTRAVANEHLKIGTLVLIAEDTPPMLWKIGRIIELFPGADGLARVAAVRTAHGIYRRAVRKLAVLPLDGAKEEE